MSEIAALRILLVTEDLPAARTGGLARHLLTIAHLLADRGHQVDIAHRKDAGPLTEPIPGRGIACLDLRHSGWKESRLRVFIYPRRVFLARRIAAAIRGISRQYDVVHYHGHLPILSNFLPRSLNTVQTVHDYGGVCAIVTRLRGGGICDTMASRDCVACVTKQPTPSVFRRLVTESGVNGWRAGVRSALSRTKTIFVSRHVQSVFEHYLGPMTTTRTWTIPNLVNPHTIRAAAAFPRMGKGSPREPSLFMSGAVFPAKGFEQLLDLLCKDHRFDGLRLTLAGDGPDLSLLRDRFGARVDWLGWLDHPSQLGATAGATAVVMPSLWEEPCPTVLLEALALGKPVYALNIGMVSEPWVRQAGSGRLVTARSLADLVDLLAAATSTEGMDTAEPDLEMVDAFCEHVVERLEEVYRA